MEQLVLVEVPISDFEQSLGLRVHFVRFGVKPAGTGNRCRICKTLLPEGKGSRVLCKIHGGRGFSRDETP